MKNLKWTMACFVAVGLLAGSGCSKKEEKIGKLTAQVEEMEKKVANQNAAAGTSVQTGPAANAQ